MFSEKRKFKFNVNLVITRQEWNKLLETTRKVKHGHAPAACVLVRICEKTKYKDESLCVVKKKEKMKRG